MNHRQREAQSVLIPVLVTLTIACTLAIADTYMYPGPPEIVQDVTKRTQYLTSNWLSLRCETKDKPTLSWYRDGLRLTEGDGKDEFQVNQTGAYQCKATNQYGTTVSHLINVIKPELSMRRQIKKKVEVKAGQGHLFKCYSESQIFRSVPKQNTRFSWSVNGDDVVDDVDDPERYIQTDQGHLFVVSMTTEDLPAEIKCEVENTLLAKTKTSAKYTVTEKADAEDKPQCFGIDKKKNLQSVTRLVGEDVSLACTCTGGTIKWETDSAVDSAATGHKLTLKNVSSANSGTYKCTVTKGYSSDSMEFKLAVESAVEVVEAPKDTVVGPSQREVTLTCKGNGLPQPTAQWYINGQPPADENYIVKEDTLTIKLSQINTAMAIQCNLSNTHSYHWLQSVLVVGDMDIVTTATTPIPDTANEIPKSTKVEKSTKKSTSIILSTLLTTPTTGASSAKPTVKTTTVARTTILTARDSPSTLEVQSGEHGANKATSLTTVLPSAESGTQKVKFELPIKYILIGCGVFVVVLIIIAVVCTYLCVKNCQRQKEERENKRRYPRSNTMSSLSYISHLRDFDRESEDSGIDERSVLKSKGNIALRVESGDNYRNEFDELNPGSNSHHSSEPNIMEQHL